MILYSIIFFLVGTFLISNAIIRTEFFGGMHYTNYQDKELKEFVFSYQSVFTNFNDDISLPNKSEKNMLQSLPKDLYLIKDVKVKKDRFIHSLLPLIIDENNKILSYRYKIKRIQNLLKVNKTLNQSDLIFIDKMASKFFIKVKNRHKIEVINELLDIVDVIPNSIVLAQAAIESGWGSSRFARKFNALFGQYTYDSDNGVKPSYREEGERHLIKFFPTINHSIETYFDNINTHIAYYDFRQTRKHLRENELSLDPNILVKTLDGYAKDKNYIDTIISIIRVNQLTQYDNLRSI